MTDLPRPCMGCGTPVRNASRCEACKKVAERERDLRRGKTAERGYGARWQKARAAAIAKAPWCVECGHRGSETNPLTGDHILPVSKGGTEATGIVVRCRSCNSRRGNR